MSVRFRRAVSTGTAIAVAAATLIPCALAPAAGPLPHGAVQMPVMLTAAIADSSTTLGISDPNLYQLSPTEIATTLDTLKALGVTDIRIAVPWAAVQPSNSTTYDWSKLDEVIDAASARDMGVLGVISATPSWAGTLLIGHPDPTDYATFASAVATRYQGKISAYEVWNEPNGATFWSPPDAASYTELLKAAYPAIKAADPSATVIAGVLGAVSTVPGVTLNPVTFLTQMYADGAHGFFDALSYHPYQYTTPFSLGTVADSPLMQTEAIRALMAAAGDGSLTLWATEYGLPTTWGISDAQQAGFIHDFVVAWQQIQGAGPIFIHTTRDTATGAFGAEDNFGIFTTNWTEKPAAETIAELISELADGTLAPFDVTPYLPQNGFLQAVGIFAGQIIEQLLVGPRLVIQAVCDLVKSLVKVVTGQSSAAAAATVRSAAAEPNTATVTGRSARTITKTTAAQSLRPAATTPKPAAAARKQATAAKSSDSPGTTTRSSHGATGRSGR
ncbi:cellulase family glycosylhydrolase [Mycobacterium sp. DL592]|uniref:cellulase family glycosylhydrolase n=1 Tax=Mycobacterium sp. DL592 TaxID=2675524 RepID=UPI0014247019|nr:cellulase family glycosylhydrolase [Mycobacterium sp. DL592]